MGIKVIIIVDNFYTQLFTAFEIHLSQALVPTGSETLKLTAFINEELCLYSMADKIFNALALLGICGK